MRRSRRLLAFIALLIVMAGCMTVGTRSGTEIDEWLDAISQNSRVNQLVIHYTVADLEQSVALLTRDRVSAHYLVTDEHPPRILQLVHESRTAWHAGQSGWFGQVSLNQTSIGIEIVNSGDVRHDIMRGMPARGFQPFTPSQIKRTAALAADIAGRHQLAQENIVAHGDVAPQRKHDPGPLFPWRELAALGVGRWFDETAAARAALRYARNGMPEAAWFQAELARVGYDVPRHGQWDANTRRVLAVFQMHYRPGIHDGIADVVTAGILATLPTHGTAQGHPQLTEPPLDMSGAPSASALHARSAVTQRASTAMLRGYDSDD